MSVHHLIPVPQFQYGFTTCYALKHDKLIKENLTDKDLGVHKVSRKTTHNLVEPPLPSHSEADSDAPAFAWEALYPKGSINPTAPIPGGFGFYLSGPQAFVEALDGAREVVMSYRMMLQDDWEFVKGGKLPGIFGGVGPLSYGCTGGRQESRCQCFDLRPMWRAKSEGELYAYVPLTAHNKNALLAVPPLSKENADYGFSVGRGSFKFDCAVGKWVTVAFRVKLNDVGEENGEIELWIDGSSVMCIKQLLLRESEESKMKGMHFQTFFGGHTNDWASPKDQRAWFADITGTIIS
ncbi:polysaccharide lyase family 14 protein [Cyathus striatus]|nr:polysaccharide lyase family 14 protein [Cyathus striatus]